MLDLYARRNVVKGYAFKAKWKQRQFRDALLAHASGTHGDGLLDGVDTSATVGSAPGEKVARKTHIVKRGESLWQIARNYSVNVSQLQRWNRLGGHALKPGQALTVSAPN